jgi:hypothetical protein
VLEDDQHPIRTEDLPLPVWRAMQQLRAAGRLWAMLNSAAQHLVTFTSHLRALWWQVGWSEISLCEHTR